MKKIFLIRHAKSSWADMSLKDIDRPLNKRGFRDAPFMAKVMTAKGVKPDALVSSPANRAHTTAKYFAEAYGIKASDIVLEPDIYEAVPHTIQELIKSLDNKLDTVFLFGHNPTFTSLANTYHENYIPNVPTCGIIEVEANIDDWRDFDENTAQRVNFYYPKQYFMG